MNRQTLEEPTTSAEWKELIDDPNAYFSNPYILPPPKNPQMPS